MPLHLKPRPSFPPFVDARGLLPELLAGKSLDEVGKQELLAGNRRVALSVLFKLRGSTDDGQITIEQSTSGLDHIGHAMTRGEIVVQGSCGTHCGAEMHGGKIRVAGDAAHSAGCQMSGGTLAIEGNAGENLGGVFPGSMRGQRGGVIFVAGNTAATAGQYQRRGLLIVLGDAGDETGYAQRAGTIIVGGTAGQRTGYAMRRGTICVLSHDFKTASAKKSEVQTLAPGRFAPGYRGNPVVIKMLAQTFISTLKQFDVGIPQAILQQAWQRDFTLHHGDMLELGRGEVWL